MAKEKSLKQMEKALNKINNSTRYFDFSRDDQESINATVEDLKHELSEFEWGLDRCRIDTLVEVGIAISNVSEILRDKFIKGYGTSDLPITARTDFNNVEEGIIKLSDLAKSKCQCEVI